MNPPDALPLRDIHLPDAVSWWPPGYGWWLLVLAAALLTAVRLVRNRPAGRRVARVRELALQELSEVEARYRASRDARDAVASVSILLKRLALSLAPREQVAALTGEAWRHWLCRNSGERQFPHLTAAVIDFPYQRDPTVTKNALNEKSVSGTKSTPIGSERS